LARREQVSARRKRVCPRQPLGRLLIPRAHRLRQPPVIVVSRKQRPAARGDQLIRRGQPFVPAERAGPGQHGRKCSLPAAASISA
jgi:hypothetical protein